MNLPLRAAVLGLLALALAACAGYQPEGRGLSLTIGQDSVNLTATSQPPKPAKTKKHKAARAAAKKD